MKILCFSILAIVFSTLLSIFIISQIGEYIMSKQVSYPMYEPKEMYIVSESQRQLRPNYIGRYYGIDIKINGDGFRDDREYSYFKDKKRIIMLGDSMSFGLNIKLEDTYGKIISKNLAYDVLNFSTSGYNTEQELSILKNKAIFYQPDIIILNFCLNDIYPAENNITNHPIKNKTNYFYQYMRSKCAVIARRFGYRGGFISSVQGKYTNNNAGWKSCMDSILEMKRIADENKSKFIVVVIPFLSDLTEHHPLKKEIACVIEFCDKNNIDRIDLLPYFIGENPEELWINPVNGHPNKKANEIMARHVGDVIAMYKNKE